MGTCILTGMTALTAFYTIKNGGKYPENFLKYLLEEPFDKIFLITLKFIHRLLWESIEPNFDLIHLTGYGLCLWL